MDQSLAHEGRVGEAPAPDEAKPHLRAELCDPIGHMATLTPNY